MFGQYDVPLLIAAVAAVAFLVGRASKGPRRDPHERQLEREREAAETKTRLVGLPADVRAEVDALLRRNAKIHAIKLVHEKFAYGLKGSKDLVDARERELGL